MTGEARFTRWNLAILVGTALIATAIIAVTVVVRGHSNLVGKWAPVGAGIDVTQTSTGPALVIDDNGAGGHSQLTQFVAKFAAETEKTTETVLVAEVPDLRVVVEEILATGNLGCRPTGCAGAPAPAAARR